MKELKNDIKNKNFKSLYLLHGEENFLKNYYFNEIKKFFLDKESELLNLEIFEGNKTAVSQIIDACETYPFMAEKRIVCVKDSKLFVAGRKDDSEKIASFLKDIPEYTILIFIEGTVDKRMKAVKEIEKFGKLAEIKEPSENELVTWLLKLLKKNKKNMDKSDLLYFLRTVPSGMDNYVNELNKLMDYGDQITKEEIDLVCTKSLESKIFDMLNAVGQKKVDQALKIYKNLLMLKETPIMILAMITRQFRIIFQSQKIQEEGLNTTQIAQRLGLRTFAVAEALKQAKNFSESRLTEALKDCLQTDISIKTGKMPGDVAVELLIIKYGASIQEGESAHVF